MILNKITRIALVLSTLLVYSCRIQDTSEVVNPVSREITIDEAKDFINSQKAGARLANSSDKTVRTEYWSDVRKVQYENGLSAIMIPILYNFQKSTAMEGKPNNGRKYDKRDHTFESNLVVYKDEKGKLLADVVRIIPTPGSKKTNQKIDGKDFSGYVLAYDQSEKNFMGGWYCEKGKATKRVRLRVSKTARLANSDCDILIYRPADPDRPGQVGTGAPPDPDGAYYDSEGTLWVLAQTIHMACGPAEGGNNPQSVPTVDWGDPNWYWTVYDIATGSGASTNYNGNLNTVWMPYAVSMLTEYGNVNFDPKANFFLAAENRGIYFGDDEKALIRTEWASLSSAVWNHIVATGQKPDLSAFTIDVNTASDEQIIASINKLIIEEEPNGNGLPLPERNLLGWNTPAWNENIRTYYWDARWATLRTIIHYTYAEAQEDGISVANAFKHAMFACYHAESFGRELAGQLCNAHEGDSQQPDSKMDRWNNAQGFKIWDETGERDKHRLDYLIHTATKNGELRWIKRNQTDLSPTNR